MLAGPRYPCKHKKAGLFGWRTCSVCSHICRLHTIFYGYVGCAITGSGLAQEQDTCRNGCSAIDEKITKENRVCVDITCKGEKANVTKAFEPKFVSTARLIPRPLVRSGKISETINQLIGPNDT
jgi:hypothetical protein